MKVGDKIPIVVEIVRPAESGEEITTPEGTVVHLDNRKGNLFWASPGHSQNSLILVHSDAETPGLLAAFRYIVHLLEHDFSEEGYVRRDP